MLLLAADHWDNITPLHLIKVFGFIVAKHINYDFMSEAVSSYSNITNVEKQRAERHTEEVELHNAAINDDCHKLTDLWFIICINPLQLQSFKWKRPKVLSSVCLFFFARNNYVRFYEYKPIKWDKAVNFPF